MAVQERDLSTTTAAAPARAVTIPTYRYISPAFFERELERLWPRVWQLACSVDHVANPGDFYEHRVGPYSVLLVRGDDGELRAFQNVCRHRGNELCSGSGTDLAEIRCPFHRWTWNLAGELREVPSRRVFGIRNDAYPLFPVQVGTWGPLVFVNLDPNAEPLEEFLEGVPADCAWAGLENFRCTAVASIPTACNWKTLIEAFSETYHVQGIHREMLPMCDDVNGPQRLWQRHGKLEQSYGLPSPRFGERNRPDDQRVWEGFIEVMGERIGISGKENAGSVPEVPAGGSLRGVLAAMVRERCRRERGVDLSSIPDNLVLDMQQYNLFPNITVLVFGDMLTVVRSRPSTAHEEALMDLYRFEQHPPGDTSPCRKPIDVELDPAGELPLGLILNQDVKNFARNQRGLHQPGLTHLTVSPTEECRVVNLHRNLEAYLDISPSELREV